MRKWVLLAVMVTALVPEAVWAIEKDKELHLGASALIGFGANTVIYKTMTAPGPSERVLIAGTLAMIPGMLKEMADSSMEGNYFDWEDMAYNVASAYAGASLAEGLLGPLTVSASQKQLTLEFLYRW